MAGRGIRFEYDIGEVVLCFEPDPTKARVLYDAKVVSQQVTKDLSGKKRPAYVVHFQGWNSSWDRQVSEHYVLRNTEENRELMMKLADTAKKFCKRNSERRRKINTILHQAFGGSPPQFDDLTESEDSEDDSDSARKSGRGKGLHDKKKQKLAVVDFEIPETLKVQLEEDHILINKRNKLTQVPAKPCVVDILESFMKTFCVNYVCDPTGGREKTRNSNKHTLKCPPDKCVSLCKEFVDSLRIIFDFTLPIILLYAAEQQQYENAVGNIQPSELIAKEKDKESGTKEPPHKMHKSSSLTKSNCKRDKSKRHQQTASPAPSDASSSEDSASTLLPTPQRRITRQAVHEPARPEAQPKVKASSSHRVVHKTSSAASPGKTAQSESKQPVIPIASRTRRRSQIEIGEVLVKQEPLSDTDMDVAAESSPRHSQTEHEIANGQDVGDSAAGTESMTMSSSRGHEDAMDRILGWQLLPPDVRLRNAITPSQLYGTVHLLRMFVKLPDLLKKMQMKPVQLQIITKFIHHCLQYLTDHQTELFHEHTYIKA